MEPIDRLKDQLERTAVNGQNRYRVMSNNRNQETGSSQSMVYRIRVQGHLDHRWTDWFEGLTITLADNGDTLLTGPVADQAALHGLLRKVRDLGLPLLSVTRLDRDPPAAPGGDS